MLKNYIKVNYFYKHTPNIYTIVTHSLTCLKLIKRSENISIHYVFLGLYFLKRTVRERIFLDVVYNCGFPDWIFKGIKEKKYPEVRLYLQNKSWSHDFVKLYSLIYNFYKFIPSPS